jgi:hypothetical protein
MPNVSSTIRKQLNVPTFNVKNESTNPKDYDSDSIKPENYQYPVFYGSFNNFVKEGHKMGKAEPLFKRIAEADVKLLKERFAGVQDNSGPKKEEKKEVKIEVKKQPKEAKPAAETKKAKSEETPVSTTDFKANTVEAGKLISALKKQIAQVKLETSPEFMASKAVNLQKENEVLKRRIDSLLKELNAAEIARGAGL